MNNINTIKAFGDCAEQVRSIIDPVDAKGKPYIGLEHIAEGSLQLLGHGYTGDVRSTKTEFKSGDILFGKLRPYFRKCVVAPFDGVCSTDIWVVRAKKGFDQKYLFYWMASKDFVDNAAQGSEGTKMPRAKWEFVSRFERNVPPLPVQRTIASILCTLDDKIELNRRMNETLEAVARAMYKSWFVDFDPVKANAEGRKPFGMDKETAALFPKEFEESKLGKIPKGWKIKALGELIELVYGKALKDEIREFGNIPVYGSNGQVGWHNKKLVSGPGIVVGRKGNPGIVKWVEEDFFPIDTTFYVVQKDKCLSMCFLFYALLNQNLSSIGADSAVPGLNRNMAYMSKQIVPTSSIILKFNEIIASLFQMIFSNSIESQTLSKIRDSLLPRLLSGEIPLKESA